MFLKSQTRNLSKPALSFTVNTNSVLSVEKLRVGASFRKTTDGETCKKMTTSELNKPVN